jgi:hypothetical protein
VGLLSAQRELFEPYRAGLAEGGHAPERARMAGVLNLLCADDPDAAFERILPHLAHQLNSYRRGAYAGSGKAPRDLSVEELRRGRGSGPLAPLEVVTAAEAARRIRERTAGLPVVDVYLWASIAGMPDDLVQRHLTLVSTQLREALQHPRSA